MESLCKRLHLPKPYNRLPSLILRRNVVIVPMVSVHFSIINKQIQLLSICRTHK